MTVKQKLAKRRAKLRAIDQGTIVDIPGGVIGMARDIENQKYGRATHFVGAYITNDGKDVVIRVRGTGTRAETLFIAEKIRLVALS